MISYNDFIGVRGYTRDLSIVLGADFADLPAALPHIINQSLLVIVPDELAHGVKQANHSTKAHVRPLKTVYWRRPSEAIPM